MKQKILAHLERYRCSDIPGLEFILDEYIPRIRDSASDREAKEILLDMLRQLEYESQAYSETIPELKKLLAP